MQIFAVIPAFLWILLSTIVFGCGEYLSKRFALSPSALLAIITVATYAFSSTLWLPAIFARNQLATTGMIWTLMSVGATLGIGLIIFHEHLSLLQGIGLCIGLIAVILLTL